MPAFLLSGGGLFAFVYTGLVAVFALVFLFLALAHHGVVSLLLLRGEQGKNGSLAFGADGFYLGTYFGGLLGAQGLYLLLAGYQNVLNFCAGGGIKIQALGQFGGLCLGTVGRGAGGFGWGAHVGRQVAGTGCRCSLLGLGTSGQAKGQGENKYFFHNESAFEKRQVAAALCL